MNASRSRDPAAARRPLLRDDFPARLRTVAGLHLAAASDDEACATAVLLDADSLDLLDSRLVRLPAGPRAEVDADGIDDHGLPALLCALRLLGHHPDLALVDGHGIAHPRRLGIASEFGLAAAVPSIGVTERVLVGGTRIALHEMRGAFAPLRDGHEQIGWLLRSKPGCAPLVVSPGHRVALASAPGLVMRWVAAQRLPEPIRLARLLAAPAPHGRAVDDAG